MMPRPGFDLHQEVWLNLPFLANGRLPQPQRWHAERHVAACAACRGELALQRRLCEALAAPERISYAPAASLGKLRQRIAQPRAAHSAWLALAAACLLSFGLASLAHRALHPAYRVRSDAAAPSQGLLHIAFARDLTIGQVAQLLHSAGAEVREGPGDTGIFAVSPQGGGNPHRLRQLAALLRADPRVRWVEPLTASPGTAVYGDSPGADP